MFMDKKFQVYNGKIFFSLNISQNMIGLKFGDFSHSKIIVKYTHIKKKSKKKSKKK